MRELRWGGHCTDQGMGGIEKRATMWGRCARCWRPGRSCRRTRRNWNPVMPYWRCCHECEQTNCDCADYRLYVYCSGHAWLWLSPPRVVDSAKRQPVGCADRTGGACFGVFLLRGQNWARWVAVAWVALHVIVSVLNTFHGIVVHSLLFILIAWLLFRPEAARYFRGHRQCTH